MRNLLFSSLVLSIFMAQISPLEAFGIPKILKGKRTSDRDFSCQKRCTDPAKVCGSAANLAAMRKSCVDLCSATGKKKMLSKTGKTYDVNQYRYGDKGVLWPAIFDDVCASPQRSFDITNFNAHIATNYPGEVGFLSGLAFETDLVTLFANVAYLVYDARRDQLYSTYVPKGWNMQEFHGTTQVGSGHIAGLLMGKGNLVILAFHGTESAGDAMTDAAFIKTSAASLGVSGSVHTGFLNAFNSSWPAIKRAIITYANNHVKDVKDLEYIVVGHSLGGALASLGAAKIASDPDLVIESGIVV